MGTITRGPAVGDQQGVGGEAPKVSAVFTDFFLKNNPFLGIFWSKFLFKNTIYFSAKCVGAPPKPAPRVYDPLVPLLATLLYITCSNENMLLFFLTGFC